MPSFYVKPGKASSVSMIPTSEDKVRDEVNVITHLNECIEVGVDSTKSYEKSAHAVSSSNVTHGDAASFLVVASDSEVRSDKDEIEETELEDERGVNNRFTDTADDLPSLQSIGFIDVTDEESVECDRDDMNVATTVKDEIAFETFLEKREDKCDARTKVDVKANVKYETQKDEFALATKEDLCGFILRLRKENQFLVDSNQENLKQIALLEDEVATKQSMVDKMTDYIDEFSASCKEMIQENATLSDQQDVLNTTIQVLESNNKNLVGEVEHLKSSMQEIVTTNESLQLRIDEVTAANDTFVEINNNSEDEIADLLDVLERMTKTLEEERVSYEDDITELTTLLDEEKDGKAAIASLLQEKKSAIVVLTERLQLSHTKNDGLEAEVKSLFSRIKDNLQQIAVLEDDVAAKKSMIDAKSKDVERLNSTCKKNASENADLKKQLKLSEAESNRIKITVQDLESNVNNYFFEVDNLNISLEVADTRVRALQAHFMEQETVNINLNQVNKKRDKTITALLAAITDLQAGVKLNDSTAKMISKLTSQAKTISWGEISTQDHH